MNNFFKKVNKMMKFFNKIKNNKGNSLAEFAVTAAMMATLATTAAPRFSGVGEAGKANQTKQNLDKIGGMVNQFYMNTSAPYSPTNRLGEGQGRVPGQTKYDVQVGGYSNLDELMLDLTPTYADDGSIETPAIYSRWKPYGSEGNGAGVKWRSVFGTANVDPNYLGGVQDESMGTQTASEEFMAYLSEKEGPIKSPYKQGHYIFAVIPGGTKYFYDSENGSLQTKQCNDCGPIMVIADAYNPSKYHTIKSFN